MNKKIVNLYLITCSTVLVDMGLHIGIIWQVLKNTHSSFYVGLIVCIGALVPLMISRFKSLQEKLLESQYVAKLRSITGMAFIGVAWLTHMEVIWLFLLLSVIASSIMVISINLMEKQNAGLVKKAMLSSEKGARFIQTAIQSGAFIGALLGTWLLARYGFYYFIIIASLASIFIALLYKIMLINTSSLNAAKTTDQYYKSQAVSLTNVEKPLSYFWPQLLIIAITGLHIGVFNSMLPVYFQLFRGWEATFFGAVSGIAGIGALSASIFKQRRYQYSIAVIMLAISDVLIIYLDEPLLAVMPGFFVGFAINTVRIKARNIILTDATHEIFAAKIIATSNYLFFCLNGLAPVCITGLLTLFEAAPRQYGFMLAYMGMICSIILFVNMLKQRQPLRRTENAA